MLITVEGIDGSGKTTMLPHIKQELGRLLNKPVWVTKEPFYKQHRDMIMRPNSDPLEDLYLFCADRVAHVREMRQWIDEGHVVLCDRYTDSTIAYQLHGHQLNVHPSVVRSSACGLEPSLTLWFDADIDIAMGRIKERFDSNSYDLHDKEFYQRVSSGYYSLYLSIKEDRFELVDANNSIDDVKQRITAILTRRFGA